MKTTDTNKSIKKNTSHFSVLNLLSRRVSNIPKSNISISCTPRFKALLSIFMLPLVLSGCATLSSEECLVANWQTIGYSDGAAGYGVDRLNSHSKACASTGVSPDYQAWEQGRQQGLKQYCTQTNAYDIGKRGRRLNAVCPATINPTLQRINADGLAYYNLSRQIETDRAQVEALKREYEQLREGDNLYFETEQEARAYLLTLPEKLRNSEQRIHNATHRVEQIRLQYGY